MGGAIDIQGREYKLLLDPSRFPGAATEKAAIAFWAGSLKPLIEKSLDKKTGGGSRAEGAFSLTKRRVVLFLETETSQLASRQFTLRSRADVTDGTPSREAELTLKLRTADLLFAANYCGTARTANPKTKLEEDIAPVAVATKTGVAVPKKPTTYSRFSVSTKVGSGDSIKNLSNAFAVFPMFEGGLALGRENTLGGELGLRPGPTICEWVFEKATVDLGTVEAEFALTLWYKFNEPMRAELWQRAESGKIDPAVAEISFGFKLGDEPFDPKAALRSAGLFDALQTGLPVNAKETSKTAMGLPAGA